MLLREGERDGRAALMLALAVEPERNLRQSRRSAVKIALAAEALDQNGLVLESVALTDLDQTDLQYFNPSNRFDAAGLTRIIEEIEDKRKLRNDIEQDSMIRIRTRWACRYSTAGTNRDVRKLSGHRLSSGAARMLSAWAKTAEQARRQYIQRSLQQLITTPPSKETLTKQG